VHTGFVALNILNGFVGVPWVGTLPYQDPFWKHIARSGNTLKQTVSSELVIVSTKTMILK